MVKTLDNVVDTYVETFGEDTYTAFEELEVRDAQRGEAYWRTGWDMFDDAILNLTAGMVILGGIENCGKSNFSICTYLNILDTTKDAIVVDFILDDTRDDRQRQIVSSKGRVNINAVSIPSKYEDKELLTKRTGAYKEVRDKYFDRLEILDQSSLDGHAGKLDSIVYYVKKLRDKYSDKKIWVNIDAFDDPALPPGTSDEVAYTSLTLKNLCVSENLVVFAAKHINKNNRGRGANADAFKGSSRLGYHAKVLLLAYSEMAELGNTSQIYHTPAGLENFDQKLPVFEIKFAKNKVGNLKGKTVYYYQYPAEYFCDECEDRMQLCYKDMIASQLKEKERK